MYNLIILDLSSTFNLERDTAKEICITASIEQFILLLKRSIIIILTYIHTYCIRQHNISKVAMYL